MGWDYRIADERVELLFRLTLAAFRERNYSTDGVGNRHVGLAYMAQLLRVLVDAESPRAQRVLADAGRVVAAVSEDSADGLDWAIDTVERLDLHDTVGAERAAVELAQWITAQDRKFLRAIDRAMDEIPAIAAAARAPRRQPARTAPELVQRVALAGALLASAACGGDTDKDGNTPSQTDGGTGGRIRGRRRLSTGGRMGGRRRLSSDGWPGRRRLSSDGWLGDEWNRG